MRKYILVMAQRGFVCEDMFAQGFEAPDDKAAKERAVEIGVECAGDWAEAQGFESNVTYCLLRKQPDTDWFQYVFEFELERFGQCAEYRIKPQDE